MNFGFFNEAGGPFTELLNAAASSDIDFISDISKRILGRKDPNEINIKRNIAKSAAALTATFPVIVTEATQLEHAMMISKSIERKAVEMLRMLFAANQITNVTGAQAYLNKFHNNIDTGIDWSDMSVDDVIEVSNRVTNEAHIDDELYALTNQAIETVIEDAKINTENTLLTDLTSVSIKEFRCHGKLNEAKIWKHDADLTDPSPICSSNILQEYVTGSNQNVTVTYDGDPSSIFTNKTVRVQSNDANSAEVMKQAFDAINKGVLATDIRKANETVPSMVIINFVSTIEGGQNVVNTAVIGVKAVLHYVGSEEMINRIVLKKGDNNVLVNFIRATTGEIEFFRDFLFAIKRAKIDAVARAGKGSNSKMWKVLELRADRADLNRAAGRSNSGAAAITSIILSKAEVDIIKKEYRVDLMKPGQFVSIMRGYNLMCGVIIDEVTERADFLWDDGDKNFETFSFNSLEREDNGNLKKVITIMANSRR